MKKITSMLLILVLLFSVTGSASASQIGTREVKNAALLEKYLTEFMEMENELKEMEVSLSKTNIFSLKNEDVEDKILTRTIQEGDDLVTLGIAYSIMSDILIGKDVTVTKPHAKLYVRTEWSEGDNWASLKNVQGEVLEFYDGATCPLIEVSAGQQCAWTPLSNRTDSFETIQDSYNKSYNWPEIGVTPGSSWVVDLGHTAYFTIKRGTVSNRWQVTCNKQLEFTN